MRDRSMSHSANDIDREESTRGTRIHPPMAMTSCTIMSEKRPLRSIRSYLVSRAKSAQSIRPPSVPDLVAKYKSSMSHTGVRHTRAQ